MDIWLFPLTSHNHAPFYITFHVKKKKKKSYFWGDYPGISCTCSDFRRHVFCAVGFPCASMKTHSIPVRLTVNFQQRVFPAGLGLCHHPRSLSKLFLLQLKQGENALVARLQLNIAAHCGWAWIIREQISICLYLFLYCLRAISTVQRTSLKPFLIACVRVRVRARAKNAWVSTAQRARNKIYFAFLPLFFEPARTHNSRWVKGSHAATWWGAEIKKGAEQGIHKGLRGWVSLHPLLAWGDATLRQ